MLHAYKCRTPYLSLQQSLPIPFTWIESPWRGDRAGCPLTAILSYWDWRGDTIDCNALLLSSLFSLLPLQAFNSTSPSQGPAAHPKDRCAVCALKWNNVYIIHLAPQKVLIKLYMAHPEDRPSSKCVFFFPPGNVTTYGQGKVLVVYIRQKSFD